VGFSSVLCNHYDAVLPAQLLQLIKEREHPARAHHNHNHASSPWLDLQVQTNVGQIFMIGSDLFACSLLLNIKAVQTAHHAERDNSQVCQQREAKPLAGICQRRLIFLICTSNHMVPAQ
jgi:hypothetical protein